MVGDRKQALETIYKILNHCDTWQEVRAGIEQRGFLELLDASDFEELAIKWQNSNVKRLSDKDLSEEIEHWSKGGNFSNHLQGFNAIKPKVLLGEAEKRGWNIKKLPSGFAINTPKRGLMFLKNINIDNI